ncbi:MAG: DUF3465 domain-containing protein [Planctomycetota bacterium]
MAKAKTKSLGASVLTIAVIVIVVVLRGGGQTAAPTTAPFDSPPVATASARPTESGEMDILDLYRREASDQILEIRARISRLLPDDNEGSRHQRFIVRFEASGHTVLISHNIDLAPRVPAETGDWVTVRGEYEWTDRGGVMHWTHHNPNRNPRHPGGWIEHNGRRYE